MKLCCPQAQVLFRLLYPSSLQAMKGKAAWGCDTCQELQCLQGSRCQAPLGSAGSVSS